LCAILAHIDAQAAEIARLREAKWIVRHADTANDTVLMGMARDGAISPDLRRYVETLPATIRASMARQGIIAPNAEGKAMAEQWNASHPVGTPVRYRPVRGQAKTEATKTRSEAWTLGNGEPVVAVEGQAGGVSLKHLKVITKRKART
jgi:hypothetical protein